MQKVVILGCGFVGKYLADYLKNDYLVYTTSRNPNKNLNDLPNPLLFNLNASETFKNIPNDSIIIWNFPAEPLESVEEFYNYCQQNNIQIKIIYGSTSAYIKKEGVITEEDITNESTPRVKGENYLLSKGTNILQLSGIYGYSRHPFNWLNKGLIKNSNKTVNLIHTDDICKITRIILELNLNAERINISDGNNYLWKDLWKLGIDKNIVNTECPPDLESENRFISNHKLIKLIGDYRFKDL